MNNIKTVHAFLIGDEVYLVGQKEPFGMVRSVNKVTITVKRHSDNHRVRINPNNLYVGADWQEYNK